MATEQEAALRELYHLGELSDERASALEELSNMGEFDLGKREDFGLSPLQNEPLTFWERQTEAENQWVADHRPPGTGETAKSFVDAYARYAYEIHVGSKVKGERFEDLNEDMRRTVKSTWLHMASSGLELAFVANGMGYLPDDYQPPIIQKLRDDAHELSVQAAAVTDPNLLEQAYITSMNSLSMSLPLLLGTVATGGSYGIAGGAFGVMEMARAYSEDRAVGFTKERALAHSAVSGTIEAVTEIPAFRAFGSIITSKLGQSLGSRVARYFLVELAGENIAEFSQRWNDTITGLSPKPTGQELKEIALLTSLATVMSAGAQGVIATSINKAQNAYTLMRQDKAMTKALDEYAKQLEEIDATVEGLGGDLTEEEAIRKLEPMLHNIRAAILKNPALAKVLGVTEESLGALAAPVEDEVVELEELVPEDAVEAALPDIEQEVINEATEFSELGVTGMVKAYSKLALQGLADSYGVARSGNKAQIAARVLGASQEMTSDSLRHPGTSAEYLAFLQNEAQMEELGYRVTLEAVPSPDTAQGQFLSRMSFEQQKLYTDVVNRIAPINEVAKALGITARNSEGVGGWQDTTTPNNVVYVKTAEEAKRLAAALAYTRTQKAVPSYHATDETVVGTPGVRIEFDKRLSTTQKQALTKELSKRIPNAGYTELADNVFETVDFEGTQNFEEMVHQAAEEIPGLAEDENFFDVEVFTADDSLYEEYDWQDAATPEEVLRSAEGSPEAQARLRGWRNETESVAGDFGYREETAAVEKPWMRWMPFASSFKYRHHGGAITLPFNKSGQERAASILERLPAVVVRMAEMIGYMQDGSMTVAGQYLKGDKTVRIRENDLFGEGGPMYLIHELGHALDMWEGGVHDLAVSSSSELYSMNYVKDNYGKLMKEAIQAYYDGFVQLRKIEKLTGRRWGETMEASEVHDHLDGRDGYAMEYTDKQKASVRAAMELNYPFKYFFTSRTDVRERSAAISKGEQVGDKRHGTKDAAFFQTEVFAQSYGMYHTNPEVLAKVMPETFKVMEQIDESGRTSITRAEAHSRLRQILRAPGTGVRAEEISESNWEAPASAERQQAGSGVQGSRPEQRRHRRDLLPAGRRAFDWLAKVFSRAAPLGALPSPEKFMSLRSITQGYIDRSDRLVARLAKMFDGLNTDIGYEVYQYLTNANVKPSDLIQKHDMTDAEHQLLMQQSKAVKRLIRNIGRELVKAGILEQEVYEKHKDEYLPRMYLKHILGEDSVQMLSTHGKLDLSFVKKRKDLSPWIKEILLGQVNDPGYLVPMTVGRTMRDLAIHDFLNKISQNKEWVAPASLLEWEMPDGKGGTQLHTKDDPELGVAAGDPVTMNVTPQWLVTEGERILNVLENYPKRLRKAAAETARMMVQTGKFELRNANQPFDAGKFELLADNPSYGALRGAWVRKEIADSVRGALSIEMADSSWADKILGNETLAKVQSTWKLNKVALNAPTVARNVMSNIMLLNLSGMPMFTSGKYNVVKMVFNDGIKEIVNKGKYYRIAMRHGIAKSTFSSTELLKLNREYEKEKGFGGHNVVAVVHRLARKVSEFGGNVFQFTEMTGKIAKIKYEMEVHGLNEEEAVIEANKWLFDYSLVPKSVEVLRKIPLGAPFLTFYYKVTARMAEVALTNPHRFLPYVAMYYSMMYAAITALDIDYEDLQKIKLALPSYLRDKMGILPLPFRDDRGEIQFVDVSYIFPWTMPLNMMMAAMTFDLKRVTSESGIFSGPVTTIIGGLRSNMHPFYKKPIYNENEEPHDQYADIMKYIWNVWAPGTITMDKGNAFYKVKDSFWGEMDAYGNLPPTPPQAFARLFGINVYSVDQERDRARNLIFMSRAIEDYIASKESEMKKTPSRAAEIQREMQARVIQMTEDLQQYMIESQLEQ